jgi:histidinol-phosphate phosphatase family protein
MAVWKPCRATAAEDGSRVLFLDRDGVVVVEQDYLSDPDQVTLMPGAARTMKLAVAAGYLLIGVSNQSGLGRGRFTLEDLAQVMTRIDELLARSGTGFDGFYFCPHAPQDRCGCRKPAGGLLEEIAESVKWNRALSWMIGDKASDVAFGRDHGLGSVLVRTGYGAGQQAEVQRLWEADPRVLIADDLPAAWDAIQDFQPEDSGS